MRGMAVFLLLSFSFCAAGECAEDPPRGLFVSVVQEPPVLSSRSQIRELVRFAEDSGVRTLFVQVYRANKSWFPSTVADVTPYEKGLKNVSEDPLALLIREAHGAGIEVHAWLNLLSLSENASAPLLKKYGPGILTRNKSRKHRIEDYKIDGQYFLEPGDSRVRKALSTVVAELVSAYPQLDGIQFDYIRYPDLRPAYGRTRPNVARYLKKTGRRPDEDDPVWKDWKRAQVTEVLRLLALRARALRPGLQVSATGLMPYSRAFHEAMQDWKGWLENGLVDFVTLMCYTRDPAQFERYLVDAAKRTDLKNVNIAIGAYMLLDSPDTFKDEFAACERSGCRACVTLHYGSLLESPELAPPHKDPRN